MVIIGHAASVTDAAAVVSETKEAIIVKDLSESGMIEDDNFAIFAKPIACDLIARNVATNFSASLCML